MEKDMQQIEDTHESKQQREIDEHFMRRCLQLAVNGMRNAKPNPMVGAVIVSEDGRIIGEGYHVRCGEGHAEVNAFASVKPADEPLLSASTIYVSLEPCSHWGKTPPCADLIVSKGVRRVVCGTIDPFAKVCGRGVQHIREAGIEVTVGVLEKECIALNRRFMTVNEKHRPYIILKWAQTLNGIIGPNLKISTPFTRMLVHKLRTENDAILVGHETLLDDHPKLNVRHWVGQEPERIVLSHSSEDVPEGFHQFDSIDAVLSHLQGEGRQSLLVEGGAITLQGFLDGNLWDEIRVETAPFTMPDGTHAPALPNDAQLVNSQVYDGNVIRKFVRASI